MLIYKIEGALMPFTTSSYTAEPLSPLLYQMCGEGASDAFTYPTQDARNDSLVKKLSPLSRDSSYKGWNPDLRIWEYVFNINKNLDLFNEFGIRKQFYLYKS